MPSENILKVCYDTQSLEYYKMYTNLIVEISELFCKLKMRVAIENAIFISHAETLHYLIQKDSAFCVGFILSTEFEKDDLARSSVNTTILSIILAEALSLSKKEVLNIAVATFLHDIGMMQIPEKILNKKLTLTDVEKQAVVAHTVYGYKTSLSELFYTREIALSIMQHHERWDGKGYPNGLAGEEIDLGARIIAVADAFVAMITPKPYRDLMLGYQAMKNLLADNARAFDPNIIKLMVRSIGIYPIGSIVLINNSAIARVVKSSPEAPMRPSVKVLIDETGEVVSTTSKILDLRENKNLFIVRAIDTRSFDVT